MNASIIIATYNNCDRFLKPCIESIIRCTELRDVEVITVANGCTDGTEKYLETLPGSFKYLWFGKPLGYVTANNEGLKIASGEYIVLLNNDVVLLSSGWLGMLLKPFRERNDIGITGPGKWWWYSGEKKWPIISFWCAMFRRELLNEIGLLDEIFSPGCGEDIDFCIRTGKIGKRIVGVPIDPIDESQMGDGMGNFDRTLFPIYHFGGGTFSLDHQKTRELRERANETLRKRYK